MDSARRLFLVAVGFAAAGNASAQDVSPATSEQPGLSGHWILDPETSEDAQEKVRQAMERMLSGGGGRGGGTGGAGGFGGAGGGGRGGRGGGSGDRAGRAQQAMRPLFEAPEEMTITHTDAEIAVMEQDGRLRTLHPDGKKHKIENGNSEIKTRWDRARLVVETSQAQGPKLTETFSVAPDGSQLVVDIRVEGRLSVSVRRVYRPQPRELS